MHYSSGIWAEQYALRHLQKNGLHLLAQNYRCKSGEIDLIMMENETIVFIEVKYRRNNYFIDPVETIDKNKCNKIIKSSHQYLQEFDNRQQSLCRFDAVLVSGIQNNPSLEWIKNAFQA